MSGHGISDAVRASISTWITDDLAQLLWKQAGNSGIGNGALRYRLAQADSWVRRGRSKTTTSNRLQSGGYTRPYECKLVPNVGLRVYTDETDMHIKYVVFLAAGKPVGGGVVSVPSVHLSSSHFADRRIRDMQFDVPGSPRTAAKPAFRPFTQAELQQIGVRLEYGDESLLQSMAEERG